MSMMIKTLTAISTRGIEIHFVFNFLKTTSTTLENLFPSSGLGNLAIVI